MHAHLSFALLALAVPFQQPPAKPAPEKPAAEKPADPRMERVEALKKECEDAQQKTYAARRAAKTAEERRKIEDPEASFCPRFKEIVQENPKDEAALVALTWLVLESPETKDRDEALEAIGRDHASSPSPSLTTLCGRLGGMQNLGSTVLETIVAKNKDHAVQGTALYALATHRLGSAKQARSIQTGPKEQAEGLKGWLGEARFAELSKLDAAKTEKEATTLLERVAKDFADVPARSSTLGDSARGDLHEMRDLVVGKPAPDIEAEDLAGAAFKLSDYRGKVVLLDFWGNW
jgi:hypothetical protein